MINVIKHNKWILIFAVVVVAALVLGTVIGKAEESSIDYRLKALELQLSLDTAMAANKHCAEQLNIINTLYLQKLKEEASITTKESANKLSNYKKSIAPKKESVNEKNTNSGN